MFKTFLVAVDGSEHSRAAVHYGCELAKTYDAALHIVHVPDAQSHTMVLGAAAIQVPPSPEEIEELGRPVVDNASDWARTEGREPASLRILKGDPAQAILDCAEEVGADLIVSGRRGLGSLRGLMMGSVSQKLASHAACPVLTVK